MTTMNKSAQLDLTLQVLTPRYRRWILHLLISRDISTVDKLLTELAIVTDNTDDTLTESELMVRLQQIDLPKLESADLIMYDHEDGEIHLRDLSDEAQELLSMTKQWENQAVQERLSEEMH
ncbi:DUF7344 domain-containing protein [Halalkalicoccus tibetensis]|uniref:DUF7344 domain-containing protein n=1 Tax=Halalkalicoccus tibetensis TaxID=175632 RepID=A0ABD5V6S3_9EURY